MKVRIITLYLNCILPFAMSQCQNPVVKRDALFVYRSRPIFEETVYHCHFKNSTHVYSDVTENCIQAHKTGFFLDRLSGRNISRKQKELVLKTATAKVDPLRNLLLLQNGHTCMYEMGFCYDSTRSVEYGIVWTPTITNRNICEEGLGLIFRGYADYWYFTSNGKVYTYVVWSHVGKDASFSLNRLKAGVCFGKNVYYPDSRGYMISNTGISDSYSKIKSMLYFDVKTLREISEDVKRDCDLSTYFNNDNFNLQAGHFKLSSNVKLSFMMLQEQIEQNHNLNKDSINKILNNYLERINTNCTDIRKAIEKYKNVTFKNIISLAIPLSKDLINITNAVTILDEEHNYLDLLNVNLTNKIKLFNETVELLNEFYSYSINDTKKQLKNLNRDLNDNITDNFQFILHVIENNIQTLNNTDFGVPLQIKSLLNAIDKSTTICHDKLENVNNETKISIDNLKQDFLTNISSIEQNLLQQVSKCTLDLETKLSNYFYPQLPNLHTEISDCCPVRAINEHKQLAARKIEFFFKKVSELSTKYETNFTFFNNYLHQLKSDIFNHSQNLSTRIKNICEYDVDIKGVTDLLLHLDQTKNLFLDDSDKKLYYYIKDLQHCKKESDINSQGFITQLHEIYDILILLENSFQISEHISKQQELKKKPLIIQLDCKKNITKFCDKISDFNNNTAQQIDSFKNNILENLTNDTNELKYSASELVNFNKTLNEKLKTTNNKISNFSNWKDVLDSNNKKHISEINNLKETLAQAEIYDSIKKEINKCCEKFKSFKNKSKAIKEKLLPNILKENAPVKKNMSEFLHKIESSVLKSKTPTCNNLENCEQNLNDVKIYFQTQKDEFKDHFLKKLLPKREFKTYHENILKKLDHFQEDAKELETKIDNLKSKLSKLPQVTTDVAEKINKTKNSLTSNNTTHMSIEGVPKPQGKYGTESTAIKQKDNVGEDLLDIENKFDPVNKSNQTSQTNMTNTISDPIKKCNIPKKLKDEPGKLTTSKTDENTKLNNQSDKATQTDNNKKHNSNKNYKVLKIHHHHHRQKHPHKNKQHMIDAATQTDSDYDEEICDEEIKDNNEAQENNLYKDTINDLTNKYKIEEVLKLNKNRILSYTIKPNTEQEIPTTNEKSNKEENKLKNIDQDKSNDDLNLKEIYGYEKNITTNRNEITPQTTQKNEITTISDFEATTVETDILYEEISTDIDIGSHNEAPISPEDEKSIAEVVTKTVTSDGGNHKEKITNSEKLSNYFNFKTTELITVTNKEQVTKENYVEGVDGYLNISTNSENLAKNIGEALGNTKLANEINHFTSIKPLGSLKHIFSLIANTSNIDQDLRNALFKGSNRRKRFLKIINRIDQKLNTSLELNQNPSLSKENKPQMNNNKTSKETGKYIEIFYNPNDTYKYEDINKEISDETNAKNRTSNRIDLKTEKENNNNNERPNQEEIACPEDLYTTKETTTKNIISGNATIVEPQTFYNQKQKEKIKFLKQESIYNSTQLSNQKNSKINYEKKTNLTYDPEHYRRTTSNKTTKHEGLEETMDNFKDFKNIKEITTNSNNQSRLSTITNTRSPIKIKNGPKSADAQNYNKNHAQVNKKTNNNKYVEKFTKESYNKPEDKISNRTNHTDQPEEIKDYVEDLKNTQEVSTELLKENTVSEILNQENRINSNNKEETKDTLENNTRAQSAKNVKKLTTQTKNKTSNKSKIRKFNQAKETTDNIKIIQEISTAYFNDSAVFDQESVGGCKNKEKAGDDYKPEEKAEGDHENIYNNVQFNTKQSKVNNIKKLTKQTFAPRGGDESNNSYTAKPDEQQEIIDYKEELYKIQEPDTKNITEGLDNLYPQNRTKSKNKQLTSSKEKSIKKNIDKSNNTKITKHNPVDKIIDYEKQTDYIQDTNTKNVTDSNVKSNTKQQNSAYSNHKETTDLVNLKNGVGNMANDKIQIGTTEKGTNQTSDEINDKAQTSKQTHLEDVGNIKENCPNNTIKDKINKTFYLHNYSTNNYKEKILPSKPEEINKYTEINHAKFYENNTKNMSTPLLISPETIKNHGSVINNIKQEISEELDNPIEIDVSDKYLVDNESKCSITRFLNITTNSVELTESLRKTLDYTEPSDEIRDYTTLNSFSSLKKVFSAIDNDSTINQDLRRALFKPRRICFKRKKREDKSKVNNRRLRHGVPRYILDLLNVLKKIRVIKQRLENLTNALESPTKEDVDCVNDIVLKQHEDKIKTLRLKIKASEDTIKNFRKYKDQQMEKLKSDFQIALAELRDEFATNSA